MTTVLITTSGTGSRLGSITKHTNKSLVPVGDKLAISRIIELYPADTEFILTVGYKGNLVKEYCSLAHPDRKIRYIEVDKFEGPGSSLLYSMIQGEPYLQKPFIYHCCDTLIDSIPQNIHENTLFVCKDSDYHSYSSISVMMDSVIDIYGKGNAKNDFIYLGIFFCKDFSEFWKTAKDVYSADKKNQSLNDVCCIREMMKQNISFRYINSENFFDTGNPTSYAKCLDHFKSSYHILAKDNESLSFLGDEVIKFVSDKEINRKRVYRGNLLSQLTPPILESTNHFLKMKFIEGSLLADSLSYGDISKLLEWAHQNLWSLTKTTPTFLADCKSFYIDKTLSRLASKNLNHDELHIINDIDIGSIHDLLKSFDHKILFTDTFSFFHGDFILDNILRRSDGSFCLLDWRHEFANNLEYGDPYYDLAKLRHNIIFNHKNIEDNLFRVISMSNKMYVDLKCNYILMKQLEDFDSFLIKYNYNKMKVEILTAIIWLNMAPLYRNPLQSFLFYFGKLNLYLALRKYHQSMPT